MNFVRVKHLLVIILVLALVIIPLSGTAVLASTGGDVVPSVEPAGWESLPDDVRQAVMEQVYRSIYEPVLLDDAYSATNPANAVDITFGDERVRLVPVGSEGDTAPAWEWMVQFTGYGYGEDIQSALPVLPVATDTVIEYCRGDLTEWYINDEQGLEQGFTLDCPPESGEFGTSPLRIVMGLDTTLEPQLTDIGQTLLFRDAEGSAVLGYGQLYAYDAEGAALPAAIKFCRVNSGINEYVLSLEVDDADAVYPVTIDPLVTQVAKLTASDAAHYDYFGRAISISGDTVVVGAWGDDDDGDYSGSAYVFERNQGGGDTWGQVAKLTASDGGASDYFGYSVSISGDTVVVGAYRDDSERGSAYIFERNKGGADNWGQVAKLTASDGGTGDYFGRAVSISGDTVVVGAHEDDENGNASGSAYIFERNQGGEDAWGEVDKLTTSDGVEGDYFGYSVSISGDTIVVGAMYDDDMGTCSGSAYIFGRNQWGADAWGQVVKLNASDGADYDNFGSSVSISGDTVVVGADGDDNGTGSAYVFERNQGSADAWGEVVKLTALDGAEWDEFGCSVSISGDTVVVGAYRDDSERGSAYIFERNKGGADAWGRVAKLKASDGEQSDSFGYSISISGDTIVAGAYMDNVNGDNCGSAYTFIYCPDGVWKQVNRAIADGGAEYDEFGWSVSISGDTVVVGAPEDDDNGDCSGSAYVFERNKDGADNWGQVARLQPDDGAGWDMFGSSVSISGDTVVVGAYGDDDWIGAAYIFERNKDGVDNWGQVKKLIASDAGGIAEFGWSVSISGDTIVVGAYADEYYKGSAYVFERNKDGVDNWGQVAKLLADDGEGSDCFGYSVAISGDTVVVGASEDDDSGDESGSAYVFERNGGGAADDWGQVKKLIASDGEEADFLGRSVSISGDTVVVGAYGDDNYAGSAYVFERNKGGIADNWGQVTRLTASDGAENDEFGYSVSISNDTVAVGAHYDCDSGDESGSAYVFERNGGGAADDWGQVAKLLAADGEASDYFGNSVSISGDTVVTGVRGDEEWTGSAYMFSLACEEEDEEEDTGGYPEEEQEKDKYPVVGITVYPVDKLMLVMPLLAGLLALALITGGILLIHRKMLHS